MNSITQAARDRKVRKQGSGPIGPHHLDRVLTGVAWLDDVAWESERPWACAEGRFLGSGFGREASPSTSSIGQGSAAVKQRRAAASVSTLPLFPAVSSGALPLLPDRVFYTHPLPSPVGRGLKPIQARGRAQRGRVFLPLTYENQSLVRDLCKAYNLLGYGNTAARVRDCGRRHVVYTCLNTGKHWRRAWHCHDRNCPRCAKIRANRLFHKYRHKVGLPGLKMLVLTVPSVKWVTREYVSELRRQVRLLLHAKPFREAWVGGFYGIETTWNARHGFHVHVHLLIEGEYVPWAVIRRKWLEITGSAKIVWIEKADNAKQVFKYPLKPDALRSMGVKRLAAYLEAVRYLPLAQPFGSWHKCHKDWVGPDDDGHDGLHDDVADDEAEDEFVRLPCPYCGHCEYTRDVLPADADVSGIPLAHEDWKVGVWVLHG